MEKLKEAEEYMTPKERLVKLVLGQQLDRVPVLPFVTAAAAQVLRANYREYATNPELFIKCQMEAQQLFGYDGMTAVPDLAVEAQAFGAKIVFPDNNAAYPDPYHWTIKSPDDYIRVIKSFKWENATRMKHQLQIIDSFKQQRPDILVGGNTIGPVGLLSRLRNPNDLLRDVIYHPDKLHEALELVTEIEIDFVEKEIEAGAGTIMVPVVLAEQELMSRKMWEELDAPYQKRIADFVRKKGANYCVHTCGRGPYLDLLIKWLRPMLVQNAHLPDDCKTEEEMIQKYGKKVIFLGFLQVSQLAWWSPTQIMAECKRELEVFGKSPGGFFLGASCEYPPYSPLYNALAVVKAARIYGANFKRGGRN
jgi:uroporphyrinogen decarboxylase